MKRKLASIQSVLAIEPIPNADAIELVRIQGWQCVVKKGEFRVGDVGVFFEIDSVPPDDERFAFLWRPKDGSVVPQPATFRLRTIRLRGMLSQGLLMPLRQFPEIPSGLTTSADVTEILQITKWETQIPLNDEVDGPFLPGVPKTDEMRVQSVPDVIAEITGKPYVITVKCDGTSATYGMNRHTGVFTVCGRNWSIKRGTNAYWHAAEKYDLEALLGRFPQWIIQAELVGPGIQKNRLGLKGIELRVFNVYDQHVGRYLDHDEASAILSDRGLSMVDELERGESFSHDQASLLALAEGFYPGTQNEREGLVIRPQTETHSQVLGGRLSFKAISNRFLLKGGD
ncbi:MAG TPA: RNA ligase (ATP) [Verrucomicrobiales bacterium]|nr:RNA ligase (ATP) [Verrucomicrobiales bacterium]HRJ07698.1 RNA ligase (ATP) [Prosthecobacter sp.]HRK15274.1 RNA ligase (ATP) [Prosthecobacter sp.]